MTGCAGGIMALSVILPVYNAMPWLPLAVRDMLKQDLGGVSLELICADDASRDGSMGFLEELAALLGARASCEDCLLPGQEEAHAAKRQRLDAGEEGAAGAPSTNPALRQALRAAETQDHPSFQEADEPEELKNLRANPVTVADVAAACRPEHHLRVLSWADGVNRGQGASMTLCLSRATAPLLAQMESDDERASPDALRKMMGALADHPDWDGVSCRTTLIGWPRPGMERYVAWQNSLVTPEEMAAGRFIEIPALHQTAMFRTAAVRKVTGGRYRDGPVERREGEEAEPGDALDVPVDMHWWLAFFHAGLKCGKVKEALFGWRQHPRQHTRTHGRLSIEALRLIKVHFLLRDGAPAHRAHVQVWSVGKTVSDWETDLNAHVPPPLSVTQVVWKPGQPRPAMPALEAGGRVVRLFAFGQEKARNRVRQEIKDWNHANDLFVG